MSSQTNTLHVVINASGAQSGSAATVNAINSIVQSAMQLNVTINQTNNNLNNIGRNTTNQVSTARAAVKSLTDEFGRLGSIIAAVQPVRLFNEFIKEITEVDRVYNGFIAMMNVTTGDVRKSAQEFDYVAKMANAYGVQITDLLKSYSKLSAATKNILTGSETKKLFQSITAVSTVLHAETYVVERMFNALIQMASKGQVHMEELKQQLGEHLPGAMAIAASAMDMKIGDMIKAMEKGKISARDLLSVLPDELMNRFGPAIEIASKSLTAQMNRLKNVWFSTFKEMSTNGLSIGLSAVVGALAGQLESSTGAFKEFSTVIGHALLDVAEFIKQLRPEDVRAFAESVIDITKGLIDFSSAVMAALKFIIDYKEEFALLGVVLIATRLAWTLYTASVALAASATGRAAIATALLRRSIAALYSFAIGWSIGTYLSNEFAIVEEAGISMVEFLVKAPIQIAAAWEQLKIQIPLYMAEAFESSLNKMFEFFDYIEKANTHFSGYLGLRETKRTPFDFTSGLRSELASVTNSSNAELAEVTSVFDEMRKDAASRRSSDSKQASKSLLERIGLSEFTIDEARKYYEQLKSGEEELKALIDTSETPDASGKGSKAGRLSRDENALASLNAKLLEAEKVYAMMSLIGEAQVKLNEGDQAALKIREQIALLESKDVGSSNEAVANKQKVLGYLNAQLEIASKLGDQLRTNALLEVNLKLDEELRLAEMLPKEREREIKLLSLKKDLLANGVQLSEAETESLRQRLQLIEQTSKASDFKGKTQSSIDELPGGADYDIAYERYKLFAYELKAVWSEVVTPLQNVEAQIYALNSAFEAGAVTQDTYNQKLGEFVIQTSELLNKLGYGDFSTSILQSLGAVMEGFVNLSYNTSELLGNAFNSMVDGLSNAVSRAIVYGEDFGEAMRKVAAQAISELLAGLIKLGVQFLINKTIADAGLAATLATQATAASAVAAMWSPAAALASLATSGANAGPAAAGIAATTALTTSIASSASFAGMFDNGGYIPNGQWGIAGEYGPEIVQGPANVVSRIDTAKMLQYSNDAPDTSASIASAISQAISSAVKSVQPTNQSFNAKIVNVIDPSIVNEYLESDEGERVVLNIIERNKR